MSDMANNYILYNLYPPFMEIIFPLQLGQNYFACTQKKTVVVYFLNPKYLYPLITQQSFLGKRFLPGL